MSRGLARSASRAHRCSRRPRVLALRAPRPPAAVEEFLEVAPRARLIETAHIQRPTGGRELRQPPPRELRLQLLDPDTAPRHDLPVIFRAVGPPAPIGVAGGEAHTGRGTAIEPDQDHLIATAQILLDLRCDRLRQAPAVLAIGRGVVLLVDGPPAPYTGERELGTGQLLQEVAAPAQRLHHRTHDTSIV